MAKLTYLLRLFRFGRVVGVSALIVLIFPISSWICSTWNSRDHNFQEIQNPFKAGDRAADGTTMVDHDHAYVRSAVARQSSGFKAAIAAIPDANEFRQAVCMAMGARVSGTRGAALPRDITCVVRASRRGLDDMVEVLRGSGEFVFPGREDSGEPRVPGEVLFKEPAKIVPDFIGAPECSYGPGMSRMGPVVGHGRRSLVSGSQGRGSCHA